jgi:hypothetical protein
MRCRSLLFLAFALIGSMALVGCNNSGPPKAKGNPEAVNQGQTEEIKTARATLSQEDRKLVDAQEFCAVQNNNHLGEMGEPVKVMVKDQPVFLCCKSCQKKALADPEKTLAIVEKLKLKVKAEAEKK